MSTSTLPAEPVLLRAAIYVLLHMTKTNKRIGQVAIAAVGMPSVAVD